VYLRVRVYLRTMHFYGKVLSCELLAIKSS